MDITENKAETRRIGMLAQYIRAVLDNGNRQPERYEALSVQQLLDLARAADTLSALVLHEDTEIRVVE